MIPVVHLSKNNKWNNVIEGKLCPKPYDVNTIPNKRFFKIPLMLRTIGGLINPAYYRPLPLGVFKGGLRILITLNPNAFGIYIFYYYY